MTIQYTETEYTQNGPKGIGGWLALLGLGMVLGPLRVLAETIQTTGYTEAEWTAFRQFPLGTFVAYFETIGIWSGVVLLFAASFLFFTKSRLFPRMYYIAWLWPLGITLVDGVLVSIAFNLPLAKVFDGMAGDFGKLIGTTIAGGIWALYIYRSRRVANTFVN